MSRAGWDDSGMDLAEFLLACLAEDEQAAKAAISRLGEGRWHGVGPQVRDDRDHLIVKHSWPNEIQHITRWDPARVLAEVEAKRAILALHPTNVLEPYQARVPGGMFYPPDPFFCACQCEDGIISGNEPCATKRILALPYADHPECHPSWLPAVKA
jgi:hypothetical protein